MKAETVLKLSEFDSIKTAQIRLDEWIAAYKATAAEHPSVQESAKMLIDRANAAFKILKDREMLRQSDSFCGDDAFMISVIEEEETAQAALDGDFPLGNEFDAEFALPYFSITDLAKIQLGLANEVMPGTYSEYAADSLVRKGFLLEMCGRLKEAERCYSSVSTSECVHKREYYCRRKAEEESNALYEEGMALIEKLNWNEAWYPLYKAAEAGHIEAMAEIGYMTVYGLGCGKCTPEGLSYLRGAAEKGSDYACRVIWQMHDDGFREIRAAEAEKLCRQAADNGDAKAAARLELGFDLRENTEILQERIDKGDIDALWYMAVELNLLNDGESALKYAKAAAQAEQTDALLFFAELYADSTDPKIHDDAKADEYYRKAAQKGSEKAILALGDRALKESDITFWEQASSHDGVTDNLQKRHKEQFAWYLLAAQGGCVPIMPHIAAVFYYGYPTEKDEEQAFLWASRAADSGDIGGIYQVGYFYENGIGCDEDMTAALMFYIQAAESGVANAMHRLADIYQNGKGSIAADKEKATRYRFMAGIGRD